MKIEDYIPTGKDNAIKGSELAAVLDLDTRDVCQAVKDAREKRGIPICASTTNPKGYFIAATTDELQNYCGSLEHRAVELFKTRSALVKVLHGILEKEAGQTTLLPNENTRGLLKQEDAPEQLTTESSEKTKKTLQEQEQEQGKYDALSKWGM